MKNEPRPSTPPPLKKKLVDTFIIYSSGVQPFHHSPHGALNVTTDTFQK
jgi:hypothetical protein